MPNALAHETSPYLLQHKDNLVDWLPWGEEALRRAREEDKPLLVSIGYSACHWCHVMERESFEDAEVAQLMNERFVCVKVDREERPDVDAIYMEAVQAMTGQGGWPLNVFCTPGQVPFYGGTYYPPEQRFGLPSFRQVLAAVADAWERDREQIVAASDQLRARLQGAAVLAPSEDPLDAATGELVGGTPGDQARQCLENLRTVCAAAGASLGDAVRVTVYLTNMAAFAEVNEVYETFFAADPPARVAIGVAALPRNAQVEVDAIVALPD